MGTFSHNIHLIDSIGEYAIIELDSEGRMVYYNLGAQRMLGLDNGHVGLVWSDICPASEGDPYENERTQLDRAEETGHSEHFGIRLTPKLERIWTQSTYSSFRDTDGKVGFGVVLRDLTARKLAESKYRSLVENAPDALFLIDNHGIVGLANVKCNVLFGYEYPSLLGCQVTDLFREPSWADREMAYWRSHFSQSNEVLTRQMEFVTKAGHIFNGEITLKKVVSANEEFISCALRDITHRLKLNQDLREANNNVKTLYKWLQGIIDSSSSYIAGIDTQRRFVAFNKTYAELIESVAPNVLRIGSSLSALSPALTGDRSVFIDHWERALSGEQFDLVEKCKFHDDWQYLRFSFSPVFNERGSIIGAAHLVSDITGDRERELLLEKSLAEAKESARVKQEFLTNMSHELRTPMNAIVGFTHLLIDSSGLNTEQSEYLQSIKGAASDLLSIINDVLGFSELSSGQTAINRVTFDVESLVQGVSAQFEEEWRAKGLLFTVSHPKEDLGMVWGDLEKIRVIIQHLVSNAIKFTPQGQVSLSWQVTTVADESASLLFIVKDTGIGIAQDQHNAIFDPFHQTIGHSTRPYGGTGLGLALAKQYAEAMGGNILLRSETGQGSEFTFQISLERVKPAAAGSRDVLHTNLGLTVLLVEDNRTNQVLAKKVLSLCGCNVELAENGQQAVDLARQNLYDVILMDIQMPILDGVEATKQIRQFPGVLGQVPIIALTAHALQEEQLRYIEAGMNACVTKPFQKEELMITITALANPSLAVNKIQ
ncbi:MAG TPA: PAS domain-containing protein [Luteibaculaceae bacterium]|nr:PAS domain-containing protein [Luteibaculaceae bacterium]